MHCIILRLIPFHFAAMRIFIGFYSFGIGRGGGGGGGAVPDVNDATMIAPGFFSFTFMLLSFCCCSGSNTNITNEYHLPLTKQFRIESR